MSLTAAFLWYSDRRLRRLDVQLRATQEKAEAVSRQVAQFSREMEQLRETTETSRREASDAKQKQKIAEDARQRSEVEAAEARSEAQTSREKTQQVSDELKRIRQVREQELEKMQEALNRVAPTRRTPSGMVIELGNESFRFDFDRANLRPENRELLSRIAGILLASKGYSLAVYGYTDDIGTDEYNEGLSERRAKSVQEYLVKAGIPPELIQTRGFGKSNPLVNAKTRAAREKNRRVEIAIVDTMIHYEGEVKNSPGRATAPASPPAPAPARLP